MTSWVFPVCLIHCKRWFKGLLTLSFLYKSAITSIFF